MKYIFTILNCVCIVLMAYFCVDMTYENLVLAQISSPVDIQKEKTVEKSLNFQKQPLINPLAHKMIVKRNLFKVEIEKNSSPENVSADKTPAELEPTTLNLVLYGTVAGPDEAYAVIEDKKIRQQALYNVGDKVQGAQIKQILRHKVILLFQGKTQVLAMEDKPSKSSNRSNAPVREPGLAPDVLPPQEIESDKMSRMVSTLMQQIKFRPHMTEGEPDGLTVYGIRPSSIFRKVGLRNGDIIKEVNGTPVSSNSDARGYLVEVLQAEQAKITLMRRGKIEELAYEMDDSLLAKEE